MAINDLFNMGVVSPEMVRQRIGKTGNEEALSVAQLSPQQLGVYGMFRGGQLLGGAAGEALGGVYPEVQRAQNMQLAMEAGAQGKTQHEMYYNMANKFKELGMGNEAFASMMAGKQAELAHGSAVAKADLDKRRVAAAEQTARASMLRAYNAAQKNRNDLLATMGKNAEKFNKMFKSTPVSKQTLDVVGARLANDPTLDEIDGDDNKANYIASIAQNAQDLSNASGRRIGFDQAVDILTQLAAEHLDEGWFSSDKLRSSDFSLEAGQLILQQQLETMNAMQLNPEQLGLGGGSNTPAPTGAAAEPQATTSPSPVPETPAAPKVAIQPETGAPYPTTPKRNVQEHTGVELPTAYQMSEWLRNL
jgi:hypothetical protein